MFQIKNLYRNRKQVTFKQYIYLIANAKFKFQYILNLEAFQHPFTIKHIWQ